MGRIPWLKVSCVIYVFIRQAPWVKDLSDAVMVNKASSDCDGDSGQRTMGSVSSSTSRIRNPWGDKTPPLREGQLFSLHQHKQLALRWPNGPTKGDTVSGPQFYLCPLQTGNRKCGSQFNFGEGKLWSEIYTQFLSFMKATWFMSPCVGTGEGAAEALHEKAPGQPDNGEPVLHWAPLRNTNIVNKPLHTLAIRSPPLCYSSKHPVIKN